MNGFIMIETSDYSLKNLNDIGYYWSSNLSSSELEAYDMANYTSELGAAPAIIHRLRLGFSVRVCLLYIFILLFTPYGYKFEEENGEWGLVYESYNSIASNSPEEFPWMYVQAGLVRTMEGVLLYIGNEGRYWDSTTIALDTNGADHFWIWWQGVYPVASSYRWSGLSVRQGTPYYSYLCVNWQYSRSIHCSTALCLKTYIWHMGIIYSFVLS